jgi:hypothetical protein
VSGLHGFPFASINIDGSCWCWKCGYVERGKYVRSQLIVYPILMSDETTGTEGKCNLSVLTAVCIARCDTKIQQNFANPLWKDKYDILISNHSLNNLCETLAQVLGKAPLATRMGDLYGHFSLHSRNLGCLVRVWTSRPQANRAHPEKVLAEKRYRLLARKRSACVGYLS